MRRRAVLVAALIGALALSACGSDDTAEKQPTPAPEIAVATGVYSPASADLNRPCTLLTPDDASTLYDQPFYSTMVGDRVGNGQVRCVQGVGVGGISAVVEAQVILPVADGNPELVYVELCRQSAHDGEPAQAATPAVTPAAPPQQPVRNAAVTTPAAPPPQAAPAPPPEPQIVGRACRLSTGGYAILMADRVLTTIARGATGEVDHAASRRLAVLLSRRLAVR